MVNSKINAKKYFLPVYVAWVVITPTIITYLSGYFAAEEGMSAIDAIPWDRVFAFYALFGLVWPLTVVVAPAFFHSVEVFTDLTFLEAFTTSGATATKARVGYLLYSIAWIGPLISLALAFYYHKKDVSTQVEGPEEFSWVDYLAAFV